MLGVRSAMKQRKIVFTQNGFKLTGFLVIFSKILHFQNVTNIYLNNENPSEFILLAILLLDFFSFTRLMVFLCDDFES